MLRPLSLVLTLATVSMIVACDRGATRPLADADPATASISTPPQDPAEPVPSTPRPESASEAESGPSSSTPGPQFASETEPRPKSASKATSTPHSGPSFASESAFGPHSEPSSASESAANTEMWPSSQSGQASDPLSEEKTAPAIPLWGLDDDGDLALPAKNPGPAEDLQDPNTPPAKAKKNKPVWVTHVVVPRETIELLAIRYRSDPGKIRSWNGLASGAQARPRKKLKILAKRTPPPREFRRYTVTEDDTWGRIGHRFGVDPSDLRAINLHRVGRRLDPGEELDIWLDPTIFAAIQSDAPPPGPAAAVSPGAYAVGRPHRGKLVNGTRIPQGSDDYELRYPGSSWGTTTSVRSLVTAIHSWRETSGYRGRLAIGTMSRERGRPIGGHLSHQCGRDVDIRLPLREELKQTLTPLGRRVDWWALWQLIVALDETGYLGRIFLDYKMQKRLYKAAKEHGISKAERRRIIQFPMGRGSGRGLVRHSPGHDRHFHARFRCADYETECANP